MIPQKVFQCKFFKVSENSYIDISEVSGFCLNLHTMCPRIEIGFKNNNNPLYADFDSVEEAKEAFERMSKVIR